jgi:hypothetical protein
MSKYISVNHANSNLTIGKHNFKVCSKGTITIPTIKDEDEKKDFMYRLSISGFEKFVAEEKEAPKAEAPKVEAPKEEIKEEIKEETKEPTQEKPAFIKGKGKSKGKK